MCSCSFFLPSLTLEPPPLAGFAKGDVAELKLKEIKNARLAMVRTYLHDLLAPQIQPFHPIASVCKR